jgi:S1-C subfamily serine protease
MKLRTLLIAAGLVAGFIYYTSGRYSPLRSVSRDQPIWSESKVLSAGLSSDENNNIDIYKAASNSVVYITSTVYQQTFFFEREVHELGSGFIITPDGQILTNNHVVSGSAALEVTMPPDQSRYNAKILLRDQANDLALIKIEPKGKLKALTLGNSEALQVGQKVLAIGNPFGFSGTLTTGIVSSLGRTIQGENQEQLEGMIQTDAAINSGNSGGPLLDSQGNVIGINTAIYGPNGGSVGIGFAMPINRARAMLDDFKNGRKPASTRVGVSTVYFTGDWAEALRLPRSGGLLISRVDGGSPAAAAGLRGGTRRVQVGNYLVDVGGDLITAVDGKPVDQEDAITRAISKKHAGETLDLTILRDGRSLNVKVMLGAQSDVL